MTMTINIQWVLNFANAIVGVGLLTIPYCYQQCGIVLATLMVLGSGHLTKVTCEFLLRAGSYTRKSTYEQLALLVYGSTGKLLCELSTIGVSVGSLVAFQVVIGDLAPAIVTGTIGLTNTWFLRAMLMVASCGVVLPLCLMRSVSSLANLNTISMSFYSCFIFVVCCLALPNFSALEWWTEIYFWKPAEFFKCLPIILLSYNCQAQVFIFYGALPDPNMKTMIAIVHKAINLVNMFYITVGLFGYIAFYKSGVHGDVMESFPTGFLTVIMKLGFLLSVVVSFPLMCFPVRSSINSLLFSDKKQGILHDVITNSSGYIAPDKFVMITLGLVSSTVVVGILVPKIEVVLSITGALAGSFICLVFPSALFVMAGAKDRLRSFGLAVLLLSAFFMITCTSSSLYGLMAGEPPPVPQDIVKTNIDLQGQQLVPTELPIAKIATIAANLAAHVPDQVKVPDKVIQIPKEATTVSSTTTTKRLFEVKVPPDITKVEEKNTVINSIEVKPDEKQISELNNALHGKVIENIPTGPQTTVPSVKEVKKAVAEELATTVEPNLSKVTLNPKAELIEKPKVDAGIKTDVTDKQDNSDISKIANKVLNISNNEIIVKKPPLEIPSVQKTNESERKTKINREILSKT